MKFLFWSLRKKTTRAGKKLFQVTNFTSLRLTAEHLGNFCPKSSLDNDNYIIGNVAKHEIKLGLVSVSSRKIFTNFINFVDEGAYVSVFLDCPKMSFYA